MLARRARLACAFRPASPSLGGGPEETIYLANAQNKRLHQEPVALAALLMERYRVGIEEHLKHHNAEGRVGNVPEPTGFTVPERQQFTRD